MKLSHANWLRLLLVCALAGCARAPVAVDTGSRDVVRVYFEGLCGKDWARAYAALHPDSQKRISLQRFTHLAQVYRKSLGFEPLTVQLRSCEEHPGEAIARVTLLGAKTGHRQRYNDSVVLRQHAGTWKVVLADAFGRQRR